MQRQGSIRSLRPRWHVMAGERRGERYSVAGCVVRNQSSLSLICRFTPPVHDHLERMPGTGLVAELDSLARSAARLGRKVLEGKGLFAVHACLSCDPAPRRWTSAHSADVGCAASQQDNILLLWRPKRGHKTKSPEPGLVTGCRGSISVAPHQARFSVIFGCSLHSRSPCMNCQRFPPSFLCVLHLN